MVAVLLRLRLRVLANTLQRDPVQLVAVLVGGALSITLTALALLGMLLASTLPVAVTQAMVVVGGSALVFGWLIVPLLFDGVDRTLEQRRLARFPLSTGTLMVAMFLVGVTWIPGVLTIALSLGTSLAWRAHPFSAVVAVIAGLVGAATCVIVSRLATSAVGTVLRGRGAARAGVIALAILVLAAVVAAVALPGVSGATLDLVPAFSSMVVVLGWTPLGAVWSVPGRLAMGDPAGAAAASVIAVVTVAVLLVLWRATLRLDMRVSGEGSAPAAARGRPLVLGWMPATPTGAIAARSLIYWFRDARIARQLLLLPVLPALMLLWWRLFDLDAIGVAAAPVTAAVLPLSMFAGLSYDGTAFAAQLAAGVRGAHDRLGRAVALLIIAVPATLIVQIAVAVIIGRTGDLPALLGLSLGTLLTSIGVISVSSARLVVPVARSGRNPYSARAGGATVSILASYAVAATTLVLMIPTALLSFAALLGGAPVLGWAALGVGTALGIAVVAWGVAWGGRVLDASGPWLLARLRLLRE